MRIGGFHLAIVALLLIAGCARPVEEALWIPSEAALSAQPQTYPNGYRALSFDIESKDPDDLVARLVRHFDERGWQQRSTMTEGGGPSSFERGWEEFFGGGVVWPGVTQPTRHWHGEWEDERGNVIAYHLRASPGGGGDRSSITCYATYTPKQ
jgi:hypothetical protein